MKRRSKSNLVLQKPAELIEPETGPGSATCYCRVIDRRMQAEEARQALRERASGQITSQDSPKFCDIILMDLGDLAAFYVAVKSTMKTGKKYRIRVAML